MMRTLLVIDDNKSVRESLKFLLMHRGYSVLVAESGPEGLALAAEQPVDGVLLDVNMPGMNGIAVCEALRARATETGRTLPVWMMTGARTPQLTKMAVDAGAITLLAKPFDLTELYRQFEERFGQTPPAAST